MIKVIGSEPLSPNAGHFWIDDYVPMNFSVYEHAIGAWYIRFGDFRTSLMEFMLEREKFTIKGFSLVSFNRTHKPKNLLGIPFSCGLPVVELQSSFSIVGPLDAQRVDIISFLSFGLEKEKNFVEVVFSENANVDGLLRHGRVEFLMWRQSLVGVRVTQLAKTEQEMLEYFEKQVGLKHGTKS